MSELDVQLESVIRYILEQGMLSGHGFLEHDGIAQSIQSIKQAFADAGYQPISYTVEDGTRVNLLSGQEWYNRLETKTNEAGITFQPGDTGSQVIVAAQQVSGILKDNK